MPTENTSLKHTTPAGDSNTSTTFLQSVLSNKLFVVLVVVVLGTGLMAYNANPVPASSQFRLGNYAAIVDGGGGGISANQNGGDLADGDCDCNNRRDCCLISCCTTYSCTLCYSNPICAFAAKIDGYPCPSF